MCSVSGFLKEIPFIFVKAKFQSKCEAGLYSSDTSLCKKEKTRLQMTNRILTMEEKKEGVN